MSLSEINMELNRRRRVVASLERSREKLLAKIRAIDEEIAANGGSSRGAGGSGGRGRARNEMNLTEALANTLRGKTMSVTEAADAVRENGYQSSSPNFRTMVNAALLNKKVFKRVGRGQYTAA